MLFRGGRNARKKSYLSSVVRALTGVPQGGFIEVQHEIHHADDDNSDIKIGTYVVISSSALNLASGPQGKSLSRAYHDVDDSTTVSRSSRSSANQSRFRLHVLLRDGRCLVTHNQEPGSVTAAHVVPFSLGQDYLDSITHFPARWGYSLSVMGSR